MPLERIQENFSWLGINTMSGRRERLFRFVAIIIIEICALTASAAFILKNISIDLEATLYTILQIASQGSLTYMILFAFAVQRKISAMFDHLQDVYTLCATKDSNHYLEKASIKSEWILQMYMKYWMTGFAVNTIAMDLFSALACWLMNGLIYPARLYHPCMLSLPWDQETLLGHIGEICFAIIICEVYLFGNGLFVLLFVSLCLHHQAFLKIFEDNLNKLQNPVDHRRNAQWKQFIELIHIHNSFKQFFLETANVYSPIIMIQLICCMLYSAISVFQLQLQMNYMNFGMTLLLIVFLTGLSNLFVFCYFGKLATDSFSNMGDCLFEYDWQALPIDLQKYFPLMIQNAQRRILYHGFGILVLKLETFTKFIKSIYTFFMLCKKVTS